MCVQIASSYPNGEVAARPSHGKNVRASTFGGSEGKPKGRPQEPNDHCSGMKLEASIPTEISCGPAAWRIRTW